MQSIFFWVVFVGNLRICRSWTEFSIWSLWGARHRPFLWPASVGAWKSRRMWFSVDLRWKISVEPQHEMLSTGSGFVRFFHSFNCLALVVWLVFFKDSSRSTWYAGLGWTGHQGMGEHFVLAEATTAASQATTAAGGVKQMAAVAAVGAVGGAVVWKPGGAVVVWAQPKDIEKWTGPWKCFRLGDSRPGAQHYTEILHDVLTNAFVKLGPHFKLYDPCPRGRWRRSSSWGSPGPGHVSLRQRLEAFEAGVAATRSDQVGDVARGVGAMAIKGVDKARELDREHDITGKVMEAGSKARIKGPKTVQLREKKTPGSDNCWRHQWEVWYHWQGVDQVFKQNRWQFKKCVGPDYLSFGWGETRSFCSCCEGGADPATIWSGKGFSWDDCVFQVMAWGARSRRETPCVLQGFVTASCFFAQIRKFARWLPA